MLHANRAAAQILGYASFEEGIGIMLVNLYKDPKDRAWLLDQIQRGKMINDKEFCLVKKDGGEVWVSASITAQYDRAGEIQWLEGAIEDITERRKAEEALRRAHDELERRVEERTAELVETNAVLQQYTAELEERNAELDAFAHTVAHDLKNPMGVVVGYAESLERDWGAMPNERAAQFLSVIARHGRKMTIIVDELLLLSSVREQKEIELHPLDMGEIVAAIEEAVPRAAGQITFEAGTLIGLPDSLDDASLLEFLGEVPDTPLAEGVGRTVEQFRGLVQAGRIDVASNLL